jgi:peptide chain release factor 2
MRERTLLSDALEQLFSMTGETEELSELVKLAQDVGDQSLLADMKLQLESLEEAIDNAEFARRMDSPNDESDAILEINAGAGGTESCDWAQMLLRMYTRWAESHGFKVSLLNVLNGEDAGIKNAVLQISGSYAYGYLKAENGVHRLVRISPFDTASRRHTSFSSVFVVPERDDKIEIEVAAGDLRIDTFRASGAGGRNVNRPDSAVRMTHIQTGIVVSCQAERSQHKNREKAMKVMIARLADLERRKRDAERDVVESSKMGIDFGSQIRSYVLAPYRMVKDHRTNHETGNADAVLEGGLDDFIKAFLLLDRDATQDAN